jgi:hypothetical protein
MSRALLCMALLLSLEAFAQRQAPSPAVQTRLPPVQTGLRSMADPLLSARVTELFPNSRMSEWRGTGSQPHAYELVARQDASGCGARVLRSQAFASDPLGTAVLWREAEVDAWRGKKLRLSVRMRAGAIEGWAGAWIRVDGKDPATPLAFDNMQDRPLKGTTGCEWTVLVLDVPPDAQRITLGFVLKGPGALWLSDFRVDEAPAEVPSTDLAHSGSYSL